MRYKSRIGMRDNITRYVYYLRSTVRTLLYLILSLTHTRRVTPRAGWYLTQRGQGTDWWPAHTTASMTQGRVGSVGTDRYDNITPLYCIYIITPIIIQTYYIGEQHTTGTRKKTTKKNGLNYSDYPFCFS